MGPECWLQDQNLTKDEAVLDIRGERSVHSIKFCEACSNAQVQVLQAHSNAEVQVLQAWSFTQC